MNAPHGTFFFFWRQMNTSYLAGLIFFLAFAGMILVHELGHFLAARLFGIEVEEFGFGLPPRALVFWRLKGYFLTRSGKRIEIPQDFGLPFLWSELVKRELTLTVDYVDNKTLLRTIDMVEETSEKNSQGGSLATGQILVDGNGNVLPPQETSAVARKTTQIGKLRGTQELVETIAEAHPGTEFTLNWLPVGGFVRPKGENDPNVPGGLAAANPWKRLGVLFAGPIMNLLTGVILITVLFMQIGAPNYHIVTIADVSPGSPAEQAGFKVGDIVRSVNGQEITGSNQLQQIIRASFDQPLTFVFQRGEETVTITATPSSKRSQREGALGFIMSPLFEPVSSWFETVGPAFRQAYNEIDFLLSIPGMIMDRVITAEEARPVGLKGIFDMVNESLRRDTASREASPASAEQPTFWTLQLMISLTISIGLINLFPFPALDGGRIIFAIPEIVFRRRVPHQFENAIHAAGMILLLLLMLYVNVMDFVNPIVIPTP